MLSSRLCVCVVLGKDYGCDIMDMYNICGEAMEFFGPTLETRLERAPKTSFGLPIISLQTAFEIMSFASHLTKDERMTRLLGHVSPSPTQIEPIADWLFERSGPDFRIQHCERYNPVWSTFHEREEPTVFLTGIGRSHIQVPILYRGYHGGACLYEIGLTDAAELGIEPGIYGERVSIPIVAVCCVSKTNPNEYLRPEAVKEMSLDAIAQSYLQVLVPDIHRVQYPYSASLGLSMIPFRKPTPPWEIALNCSPRELVLPYGHVPEFMPRQVKRLLKK